MINFQNHLFLKFDLLYLLLLVIVNVYEDETVPGAFKPTYSPPVVSLNLNAPVAPITTFVPSQTKLAEPPKAEPPSLN
jgi:hypothetical protein